MQMKRTLMVLARLIVVLTAVGSVHMLARLIWRYGLRSDYDARFYDWSESPWSFDGAGFFEISFVHLVSVLALTAGTLIVCALGSWILFGSVLGRDACTNPTCRCKRHERDNTYSALVGTVAGLVVAFTIIVGFLAPLF